MLKSIAAALVLAGLVATPALAAPICSGSFALSRERFSEREINDFNLDLLRSSGIPATRAEIWGGCIRAFVAQPDGSEQMEFYEPIGLRRVQ